MHGAVQTIENLEDGPFRAPLPLREHDGSSGAGRSVSDQARRVLRPILAIGIHHDDGAAGDMLVHMTQPSGNRPLVSEISAQAKNP